MIPAVIKRATDDDIAPGRALSPETALTYDNMLMMLSSPRKLQLSSVASLLRPFCHLNRSMKCSGKWVKLPSPSINLYMSSITISKDRFSSMCSGLLQYLTEMVSEVAPVHSPGYEELKDKNQAFSDVVIGIQNIVWWGLSYYGSSETLSVVIPSVGNLQLKVWKLLMDRKYWITACGSIGAAMQATITPAVSPINKKLSPLKMLKKSVIWRLLHVCYEMDLVPQVEKFVRILGRYRVVVHESNFLDVMRYFRKRFPVPPLTDEHCKAADQIHTTMLEALDISSYSDSFLEYVLEWLEIRQTEAVIDGSRAFNILRKLLRIDKNRRWEKRFRTLFRRYATSVSERQLVDCLRKVAEQYNSYTCS